jgi:hypothetical protein
MHPTEKETVKIATICTDNPFLGDNVNCPRYAASSGVIVPVAGLGPTSFAIDASSSPRRSGFVT